MKKLLNLTIALFVIVLMGSCDKTDVIGLNDLPSSAKTFVQTYFSNLETTHIVKDKDDGVVSYKVTLSNGNFIEFDKEGNWKEIKCYSSEVPASIIPEKIKEYLLINFPDVKVLEIDRDVNGYEVTLSQGLEVTFDNNFQVIKIDK